MPLIEWTDELSVGIKVIDAQHKVLVKFINDLDQAQKEKREHKELAFIIDGLVDYTIRHFQYEEYQFKKHGYGDSDEHKKEHEALTQTVLGFKEQFDKGDLSFGPSIMDFLKEWLVDHIMKTDKAYVPTLGEALS